MSAPRQPSSLRERLKLISPARHARTSSQDGSDSEASASRPSTRHTGLSQTQILPPRVTGASGRPALRPLQSGQTPGLLRRGSAQRSSSLDFPERLKEGEDAGEDVTQVGDPNFLNRSFLNMITAAGSSNEYHGRLDDITSDSEEEEDKGAADVLPMRKHAPQIDDVSMSLPFLPRQKQRSDRQSGRRGLLQSLHRLKLGPLKARKQETVDVEDAMSSSQILMPQRNPEVADASDSDDEPSNGPEQDAPYLSMILQGEAEMAAEQSGLAQSTTAAKSRATTAPTIEAEPDGLTLASRLMAIFQLPEPEEVIAEYPAWFLQTVLLSGYLYITARHICFYAYMPKNNRSVSKSGYLSKRGQRNPHYKRYYVELKGNVLRYYNDPKNPYMPNGQIDLRSGTSATLHQDKSKPGQSSSYIKLVTTKREYFFRADSPSGARAWIKQLQKIIFQTHNDSDSVKILLPIDSIVDFEVNQFLDISDTIKLRVIDNDETYSVDEYFFSFFGSGRDAVRVISSIVEENSFHQSRDDQQQILSNELLQPVTTAEHRPTRSKAGAAVDPDSVGHTPTRRDSRRSSFESQRSSADAEGCEVKSPRRGREQHRQDSAASARVRSDDSNTSDWNDHGTESSAAGVQSMDESNLSSSQILNRSDVFRAPTSHAMPRSRSVSEESRLRRRERLSLETVAQPQTSKAGASAAGNRLIPQTPTALNNLIRAGAYPVGRAAEIANMIKDQSRKIGSQVTAQSMDYIEKISGMWQAPTRHYGPVDGMPTDDDAPYDPANVDSEMHSQRFREHFALPEGERLIASYFGSFWRVLPLYGKIYISQNFFCYRSLLPGTRTKLVLPLGDIESVSKKRASYRPGYPGLVLTIRGHEEIFFDFSKVDPRDDCTVMLILVKDAQKSEQAEPVADHAVAEYRFLKDANTQARDGQPLLRTGTTADAHTMPVVFDDPKASILNFKPAKRLNITCLTIGSRGDVQPYIALAKGLIADGHHVRIATHAEFEPWIRKHNIDFAPVSGDPGELMRICIQHGMFTYNFLREASSHFRVWIDDLLVTAWEACQGADLLIESPSAMAGIHIAEKLQIPYFRAFTMPWTRTRAYPHAFAVPSQKQGGGYNYLTYVLIDGVFWKGVSSNVNRWRAKTLGLPPTSLNEMQQNKVPFLYAFSPQVVAPPLDFSDWIRITGYWFLDEGDVYEPPAELVAFIKKAKADNKKLVYIGFGSILVDDPVAMTNTVIDAVHKADVRCILAKGWSDRQAKADITQAEPMIPSSIFVVKSIPHDWLFPQCDAVAHHGGCGTTGASLRAGIPVIAKPFFGDQYFFGSRIEDLGVGIHLRKLNSTVFGRALWEATRSERMKARARAIGEMIRKEDGVGSAITALYRDLDYARSLIRRHGGAGAGAGAGDAAEHIEEHWTFVEAAASAAGELEAEEKLAEEVMRLSKER